MDNGLTKKQQYNARKNALWTERATWITRYQDITNFLLPYSGRWISSA